MQEPYLASIRKIVSSERLAPYCMTTGDTDIDIIGRYLWNTALGEALYPSLQGLEIALRNSINMAISEALHDVR